MAYLMVVEKTSLDILGRLGNLIVKIADCPNEIESAQMLRHLVFNSDTSTGRSKSDVTKDEDYFDPFCDHLIVVEQGQGPDRIVATYRLMGPEQAAKAGRYYSQNEFDVNCLIQRHPNLRFLELGRSCVLPEYRTKRTIELLWHGSWAYVRKFKYDVMFGCASFTGTKIEDHRSALSFLASNASPDEDWEVMASGDGINMDQLAVNDNQNNLKAALRGLPPLIKGYLRLGAMFASEAVIDRDFGSIDVLVILPVTKLNPRYVNYYGENAERHSDTPNP